MSVVVLEVGPVAGWGPRWWWGVSPCLQPPPLSLSTPALLLKQFIHVAIPDIPGWVAEEMAKLEYQRREAFQGMWARARFTSLPESFPLASLPPLAGHKHP